MNVKKIFRGFYMAEDDGGSGAAGGAGSVDPVADAAAVVPAIVAPAGGAAPVAAAAAPVVPGATGKTALGDAAAGTAQVLPASIPEKYQVKKEDGTIDTEASSLKLAEAYVSLEKRLGAGDLPPKGPEDYKITVPAGMEESWKPAEDPALQEFLKEAHAAGLNQKQVDMVMGKYMQMAPELVNASRKMDADACVSELKQEWKTEEQYKGEVGKAYKAAVGYFGKDAEAFIASYGNDPKIIRALAKIGGEMGEDTPGNFDSVMGQGSIDSLMTSEAYNNSKHADHAKVSAQVKAHFDALAKQAEKAGTSRLM